MSPPWFSGTGNYFVLLGGFIPTNHSKLTRLATVLAVLQSKTEIRLVLSLSQSHRQNRLTHFALVTYTKDSTLAMTLSTLNNTWYFNYCVKCSKVCAGKKQFFWQISEKNQVFLNFPRFNSSKQGSISHASSIVYTYGMEVFRLSLHLSHVRC